MRRVNRTKERKRNQKLLDMIDSNLAKIEADNRDLNTLFKSMLGRNKSEYTPKQIKELQILEKQIQEMDEILTKLGE